MSWTGRFATLVARKEEEAGAAALSPFATDTTIDGRGLLRVGNEWSERLFDGPFFMSPPPSNMVPAVSLVFVQSADGSTGAADPSALGGGDTDKHLIYEGLSRVAADAVLAGAETIRGSDLLFSVWHPELVRLRETLGKPRHPIQIVATLRGLPFDRTLLYNVPDLRVVVMTIPSVAEAMRESLSERPWITPLVMESRKDVARGFQPSDQPDMQPAFETVRRLGIERVSCVGGRTIATTLIDARLVQDLYLTTSATPGGEPNTPLYPRPLDTRRIVRKRGTGADTGVTFEHRVIGSR